MDEAAAFKIEDGDGGKRALLTGDWTATHLGQAPDRLSAELQGSKDATVDLTGIGRCDTFRSMERAARVGPESRFGQDHRHAGAEEASGNGAAGHRGGTHAGGEAALAPCAVRAHRPGCRGCRRQRLRHHGVQRPSAGRDRTDDRQSAPDPLGRRVRSRRARGTGRHSDRGGDHLLHRRGGRPAGREPAVAVRCAGVRRSS